MNSTNEISKATRHCHLDAAAFWRRMMRRAAQTYRGWRGRVQEYATADLRSARRYRDLALQCERNAQEVDL